MNKLKQNIKYGLIQGLTILFVLSIGGVGYAAFTTFMALEAATDEVLTADKWNSMVDAIEDKYSVGIETLTNKVWTEGGITKSIHRKIVALPSITCDKVWRDVNINLGASNIKVINSRVVFNNNVNFMVELDTSSNWLRNWQISDTTFSGAFGSNMTSYINGGYLVFEYIKN